MQLSVLRVASGTGGLCRKHGVKCSAEGCWRQVVQGGVCIFHGAVVNKKDVRVEGCTTAANKDGFCVKHGGYTRCRWWAARSRLRRVDGAWLMAESITGSPA